MTSPSPGQSSEAPVSRRGRWLFALVVLGTAAATMAIAGVLVTIFQHRQEARTPFVRLVDVNEASTDPAAWGTNWPSQYDGYLRTVDDSETEFGGSNAMPPSKLDEHPWLKRMYAGYAFSLDYREARGHAYMLHDQEVTERVTKRPQSGSCLHCHASVIPTYRRLGLEAKSLTADVAVLGGDFNWPAVMEGFRRSAKFDYPSMHAELEKTPQPDVPGAAPHGAAGGAHPVSCVDCHDPQSMHVRVTRPGFVEGIIALAQSQDPVPHLPSIARWRAGDRQSPYDPNRDASRQEMRSFVCGQCHVEYYCGSKMPLTFPWGNGLKADDIEQYWDTHAFPDQSQFLDYRHGETGAPILKAQHPEFELWSQGVHARSGVSCADCHMPYERQGAMKVSSHWVRSPLLNINRACQSCHKSSEAELAEKVKTIQSRTDALRDRAAQAMVDMLDAIDEAQRAGVSEAALQPILNLQRRAMWRLDFISSENSHGFHADQEAMRVLAESLDYSRQAQVIALRRAAAATPTPAAGNNGNDPDGTSPAPATGAAPAEPGEQTPAPPR